jgi:membrane protein
MRSCRTAAAERLSKCRQGCQHWLSGLFPNLVQAAQGYAQHQAASLAAAVAYYLALSLFPLLMLLLSGLGMFLRFTQIGHDAEAQLLATVRLYGSEVIEQQIGQILVQLRDQSVTGCPVSLLAACLTAAGVFHQLEIGFQRIWLAPSPRRSGWWASMRRTFTQRLVAFCLMLALGAVIGGLLLLNLTLVQLRQLLDEPWLLSGPLWLLTENALTVLANGLVFAMIYRWLPRQPVSWPAAMRGGVLAACLWEIGRTFLGLSLIGMQHTAAYGVLGSFIALLLWCYYGVSILFFGAEYVRVLGLSRSEPHDRRQTLAVSVVAERQPPTDRSTSPPVRPPALPPPPTPRLRPRSLPPPAVPPEVSRGEHKSQTAPLWRRAS